MAKNNPKNFVKEKNHAGWGELSTLFKMGGKETAAIGFLRSSGIHKNKDGEPASKLTVAQIAAVHEFGSSDGRIPERSFMRSALNENKESLTKMIKKLSAQVGNGFDPKKALGLVAQYTVQLMKNKIISGVNPPLAQSTIDRKGSSKPLIDTGQMLNSIEFEIRKDKK